MNSDFVVAVSDKATDNLNLIFNTQIGKDYLINNQGIPKQLVERLPEFGFSSIANIVASIKLAKYMKLGKEDSILTVATDGAELYLSELEKLKNAIKGKIFNESSCHSIFRDYIYEASTDNMIQLSKSEKERIFNLGYYTWVEQQNISLEDFEIRREQKFWDKQLTKMIEIDSKIEKFNNQITN